MDEVEVSKYKKKKLVLFISFCLNVFISEKKGSSGNEFSGFY